MTAADGRLEPVFSKTKTICFGRFLVDLPESAIVVWATPLVPLDIAIYPNGIHEVKFLMDEFIKELKSEKAIYHNDVPLLLSVDDVAEPLGKIVVGYEDFESVNDLRMRGYFKFGDDGVVIQARPLRSGADDTANLIKSMAQRLQHRAENEIPTGAGNCIENAFLPDLPNPSEEDLMEHIRFGFRLKEFPDAHFSFYLAPANPHDPEGDSLEKQFKRIREESATPQEMKLLASIKYLRESSRRIREWLTGYEVLMRTPDEEGSLSHHDFQMKFTGVPRDPYKPYADIQFQTGVVDDAAGAGKASLSDDEAIAVWDKITSTIRVRPTGGAPKNATAASPRLPLGELAATGRVCPQTGWWQSSEANVTDGGGRKHVESGERMPHVTLVAKPSLWQKLKGETATYRAATMWKLVDYGDAVRPTGIATQGHEMSADKGKTAQDREVAGNTEPPSQKG